MFSCQDNAGWSHKQEEVSTVPQEGNPLKFPIPPSLRRTDGSCDLLIFNSPSWGAKGMLQLKKATDCSNAWINMPDWFLLFAGKKKITQSVSCSGLGWIKQRLLLGLVKFGSLFNMACLKICFLKSCPNTPCELPVPPFSPVLSPAPLCNASCENCPHAVPSRHQPGCQRARATLFYTSLRLFVN